jgi:hypothetical protein
MLIPARPCWLNLDICRHPKKKKKTTRYLVLFFFTFLKNDTIHLGQFEWCRFLNSIKYKVEN